jgi:hypothetical protein
LHSIQIFCCSDLFFEALTKAVVLNHIENDILATHLNIQTTKQMPNTCIKGTIGDRPEETQNTQFLRDTMVKNHCSRACFYFEEWGRGIRSNLITET